MPNTHQLFSEHSEITEALLKTPNVGLSELLANHVSSKILKYFIVSGPVPTMSIQFHSQTPPA